MRNELFRDDDVERVAKAVENDEKIAEQAFIQKKYEGYLVRQNKMIAKSQKMENKAIPADFDFDSIPGLLNESRQKLKKILPRTLAQAGRIPGVTPSDVGILLVYLERRQKQKALA